MEERQDRTGQGERRRGSGSAPMGIKGFLLARIAEDERAVRDVIDRTHVSFIDGYRLTGQIERHDPARALRECAAKRELVYGWHDEHGGGHVLKTLASVYSDHPDYQPKWAF